MKKIKYIIFAIVFICFIISGTIFLNKSISLSEKRKVSYEEKGSIDYKVRLKDNDFYDHKVLNKNMSYIANLIDKVKINYEYNYETNEKTKMKFDYQLVGLLRIVNPETREVYLEKEYELSEIKKMSDKNNKINIKEAISIDYDYYNDLAKSFKKTYDIETDSYLNVALKIIKDGKSELINEKLINKEENLVLKLPLSMDAISIKIDSDSLNNNDEVSIDKYSSKYEKIFLLLGLGSFIISIIIILIITKFYSLIIMPTTYEKILNKYIREYDRFLEESTIKIDKKKFNVTEVNTFLELVDLQYIYKKDIKYYKKGNEKCLFYIINDKELFLYELINKNVIL